ncbi:fused MFS/spermidine synthase [Patescibacteria group bacterium]|nr:fused MFS/spermidine synthase [Patescibacteria group bacterium]
MKNIKFIGRLEIIVFISGATVMILELIGSRILAPYLGGSIFVWTSLIGIILGALSLGYYLGGNFSKNNPSFKFLSLTLVIAGIFIVLITAIKEPILNMAMSYGIKIGSIFATTLLFVIPSILLGMVSPYSVRLKIKDVETSGSAAGNLYAISTIGSIVGTFLAGFYLIPTFGSLNILFGLGTILIVTSFLGMPSKLIKTRIGILMILFILTGYAQYQILNKGYLVDFDSSYNHIRVYDTVDKRTHRMKRVLQIGAETHSSIFLDTGEMATEYSRYMILDRIFNTDIKKVLVIGGGAYSQPKDINNRFPNAQIDVVEIDPMVTKMAMDYFNFVPNDKFNIFHEDGRIFLNNNKNKYDVIYLDAFISWYAIPFQLTTVETIEKIYNSLEDDGIVIANLISSLDGEKSYFFKSELKTFSKYFSNYYIFPVYTKKIDSIQNIIVILTKSSNTYTLDQLYNLARSEQEKSLIKNLYQESIDLSQTEILTDDFAPVDY